MDTIIYVIAELLILVVLSYAVVVAKPLVQYVSARRDGRYAAYLKAALLDTIKHPVRSFKN